MKFKIKLPKEMKIIKDVIMIPIEQLKNYQSSIEVWTTIPYEHIVRGRIPRIIHIEPHIVFPLHHHDLLLNYSRQTRIPERSVISIQNNDNETKKRFVILILFHTEMESELRRGYLKKSYTATVHTDVYILHDFFETRESALNKLETLK